MDEPRNLPRSTAYLNSGEMHSIIPNTRSAFLKRPNGFDKRNRVYLKHLIFQV